jgi:hypothetical protein
MQKAHHQNTTLTLVSALRYGFETVGAQPLLILLPILFDLFFWLGPRMSVQPAFAELLTLFDDPAFTVEMTVAEREVFQEQIISVRDFALEFGSVFNAYALRPFFPFGVPAIFDMLHPGYTPIPASVTEVNSFSAILLPAISATVIGHLGVSLYLALISYQIKHTRLDLAAVWAGLPRFSARLAILLVINTIVYIGFTLISGMLTAFFLVFNLSFMLPIVGTLALGYTGVSCLWMFMLVIDDQCSPIDAMRRGFKLLRQRSTMLSSLAMIVFVSSFVLGSFWGRVPSGSWAMLIGIIGQAIVSTGLIVAAIAYCRSLYFETQPQQVAVTV